MRKLRPVLGEEEIRHLDTLNSVEDDRVPLDAQNTKPRRGQPTGALALRKVLRGCERLLTNVSLYPWRLSSML
jgi:hypothetical protein